MIRRMLLIALGLIASASACKRKSPDGRTPSPEPDQPAREQAHEHPPVEVEGHPRLWITAADVPRLRERARTPIFRRGLAPLAEEMRAEMDAGEVPNRECRDGAFRTCESYAELFAFLSLVHPDEEQRRDYARRARVLLMTVVEEAAKGPEEDHPLRDPTFSVDDRSRWSGEAFALTVDWIYPHLTESDKETIRRVFLRWAREIEEAAVTNHNNPEPDKVLNDTALTEDKTRVRWAGNNYYTAHTRNLGLMALALDPEDDPDGKLRRYLHRATGAWLYVVDHLLRTDARGGLGPEGLQYQQQTLSYVAQLLLALETAGFADPERFGRQVVLDENRFWKDAVTAYAHLLSPVRRERDWRGPGHDLAWYGDGQKYKPQDFVDLLAPLGIHAARTGNQDRLEAIRWLSRHTAPGGAEALHQRMRKASHPRQAILYFLLAPDRAPEADPRAEMPLVHRAPGLGHVYGRTGWDADATWFRYICGWISIDHQHADGNHFGFYRRGEWLTKKRVGYSYKHLASSQFHNTLSIENERPDHDDPDDYRYVLWKRGSQWTIGTASGDCETKAQSSGPGFVYALGDASALYNSDYEGARDVAHASRSIVWLKPDHVIIYDRARSKSAGRFKRFWLQLPRPARVNGNRARMTTARGQSLYVTSLRPKGATVKSGPSEPLEDEIAEGEPMQAYLRIEPDPPPKRARFLTVLEGADPGEDGARVVHVESEGGEMEGAAVASTLVLFPVKLEPLGRVRYRVPDGVRRQLVTGLEPKTGYHVAREGDRVTVRRGGDTETDAGGVLRLAPQR